MFLRIPTREKQEHHIDTTEAIRILPKPEVNDQVKAEHDAEIRRQMYERMARGSAMAEVEANAQRKQQGN